MSDFDKTIALLGEGLGIEEQVYETCPECGRAGKLSLKRTDAGLLYYCLRATCSTRGFVGNIRGTMARGAKERAKAFVAKPFTGQLAPLTREQLDWFRDRYDMHHLPYLSYAPDRDAYAFSVMTHHGYTRGIMLRYYNGSEPKAVAYPETDGPWQAWYAGGRQHGLPLLIVEDHISAMKAAPYVNAVALMGTTLSTAGALEIADRQPSEVIVALDYDATDQAYKLARIYGLLFRSVRVLPLEQDIKDMPMAEVRKLLGE